LPIFEQILKVKEGINFILSHFEGRQPLFPRKMSTLLSNGRQFTVYDQKQILHECIKANFIDCRINAYPIQMDSGLLQAPNVIFIDLDLIPSDNNYQKSLEKINRILNKILRNIESRLDGCRPTVLWTGNGYHIYIAVNTRPLELIVELSQLCKNPSKQFLRFSEMKFSLYKKDPNHNPSFKSCLLRIPYTLNSKSNYILARNPEVRIIQSFNTNTIPKLDAALLREYRIYLVDLDLQENLKILKLRNFQTLKCRDRYSNSVCMRVPREYEWIENSLLRTPIADHRKCSRDLLLAPFLVNDKKFSHEESYSTMINWIMSCNDVMKLHPNIKCFEERVSSAIKNSNTNKIPPIKMENMQKKYPDWYGNFKAWNIF
jgi:hypothetical protein